LRAGVRFASATSGTQMGRILTTIGKAYRQVPRRPGLSRFLDGVLGRAFASKFHLADSQSNSSLRPVALHLSRVRVRITGPVGCSGGKPHRVDRHVT
jgi:hypothetical protein